MEKMVLKLVEWLYVEIYLLLYTLLASFPILVVFYFTRVL